MSSQPSRRGAPEAPDPLPIPVVDNHTHLDISREGEVVEVEDLAPVLAEAAAVGVDRVVQIGCDLPGARFAVEAAERYAGVLAGVALHPNEVPALAASGGLGPAYAEIERLAAHPRVRVVGETGLDYYRTGPDGVPAQQDSFRWHIDLAKRLGKTLQIHDRDSHDDVLRVLAEEGPPERTVLHCFSGGPDMARECVDRGYHLSFSGTVTFKSSATLRDALAQTPLELLLVETD
ncbi:MAG TPA: TatD family hydrolase, partial [Ornithinibacter sp.]|nr:TatD family hydrolase [Ornithinibacter sp.]